MLLYGFCIICERVHIDGYWAWDPTQRFSLSNDGVGVAAEKDVQEEALDPTAEA